MLAAARDRASNAQSGAPYCYAHPRCDVHHVVIIFLGPGITQCLTVRGTTGQAETSQTLLYHVMNTRDLLFLFLMDMRFLFSLTTRTILFLRFLE